MSTATASISARAIGKQAKRDLVSGGDNEGFRADVQGLRAVAVGLVLLYHAGFPIVRGGYVGVDVFFVISGFLITGQLVRELRSTGRISLTRFYARRAKRLLPAAMVVLLVTASMVTLILPKTRWDEIGGDIVSSALYVVNWRLAERSVDYLAEDSEASPVQHFWSLAVEEQYYLVWPILLLLVTFWAVRRRRRAIEPSLWVGLLLVALPSLAWSIHQTAYAPESAFFMTTTRMWELAIGGAVALGAAWLVGLPRPIALILGWSGLALIGVSSVVYSVHTAWPGYVAAVPTLGAAAVIGAGVASGRAGPVAVLGTRPFQWVGALSYSLYLWHWPLIAVAAAYWDGLSVKRGLAIALLSIVPAWLTYRFVENPLRHSRRISRSPRLALSIGANCTFVGVIAGLVVLAALPSTSSQATRTALGASVLATDPRNDPAGEPVDRVDFITPDPLEATKDVPDLYADGCQQSTASSAPVTCTYGREEAATTVALVGDSKIAQWLPAFQVLAERNQWRIVTYTKSACPLTSAEVTNDNSTYSSCTEWNRNVLNELVDTVRPDFVVTSQGRSTANVEAANASRDDRVAAMVRGLRDTWSVLTRAGIRVIVIADTPQPGMHVYECVDENRQNLTRCTYDRDDGLAASAAATLAIAADGMDDVTMVDLNDAICPARKCAPVIGNVLIYRQGSHLTATYVRTLAPRLEDALLAAGLPSEANHG